MCVPDVGGIVVCCRLLCIVAVHEAGGCFEGSAGGGG